MRPPRLDLATTLLAMACGLSAAMAADHSIDIAIIDRALASANPNDPYVKFGDVGIKYADLKVYRDRLAGTGSTPRRQSVNPQAVTPAGTTFKWPSGNVNYRFDPTQVGNNTITASKMQEFRDGVAEWAAFANLHFLEFTGSPPANYITVQEDGTLNSSGFSSSVGMAGGEQFVKFGPGAWTRGGVCHEVGHALGLWHEQQRPDRDTYVTINFNNMPNDPGTQANFAIIASGQTFSSPYDFYSVMHYARNTFATSPNLDTISMNAGYTQFADVIGNNFDRTLSKVERAAMGAIYGAPSVAPSAVVTNTKDSGSGSLRTAIYVAFDNSLSSSPTPSPAIPTTITFHIPTSDPGYNGSVFTIKPTFLLDALGSGTTIDGASQTAFTGDTNLSGPEIVLDGSSPVLQDLALDTPGVILRAANCTIKGLTIQNFNQWGIRVYDGGTGNVIGGTTSSARNIISGNGNANGPFKFHGVAIEGSGTTNNVVLGNYIGIDQAGAAAQPNGNSGLGIYLGAHGNTIGGTVAGARNVISGNAAQGLLLADAQTNNNSIQGNYIGLNASGTSAIPNGPPPNPNALGSSGVDIFGGAQSNTIGGTSAGAGNVISGNGGSGIAIYEFNDVTAIGTRNNLIQGNYIGLKFDGSAAVPNGGDGISIFGGAPSNIIGGTTSAARNIISGNSFAGIGLSESGTNNNLIQGNFIGLNATGTTRIPNGTQGISLFGGPQLNTVGGTTGGAGNVISGNASTGIDLGGSGTNNNLVVGNIIGLNPGGTAKLKNGGDGVALFSGAQSNTIGGTTDAARNVISGNQNTGVSIGGNLTNNNLVQGNYIGVDGTGLVAQGNGGDGIAIYGDGPPPTPTPTPPPNTGAQSNTIGGTVAGARNIISGNGGSGISIGNPGTDGTDNNIVQGNYIGINKAGSSMPNNFDGIAIYGGARNNHIGGTTAGSRNYISGNNGSGMSIGGPGANNNLVQGNTIGLNPAGSIVANGNQGIALYQFQPTDMIGPQSNIIGGSSIGASNMIAGNSAEGIALFGDHTIRNKITQNSIFSNQFAGIGRYDMSNNNEAAPMLSSAVVSPSMVNPNGMDVSGTVAASSATILHIEFFASPPTGDEGKSLIGSTDVVAGAAGTFPFNSIHLAAAVPASPPASAYAITATATDSNGNTSQFSVPIAASTSDPDGDGIPDNWMMSHFGHTNPLAADKSRATDDADGDGLTNAQEFYAGTDPVSANSLLRITSFILSGTTPQVGFPSVTGKTYRLDFRDDIAAGNWSPLIDGIFGTGVTLQIPDPSATLTKRYYRLTLEP